MDAMYVNSLTSLTFPAGSFVNGGGENIFSSTYFPSLTSLDFQGALPPVVLNDTYFPALTSLTFGTGVSNVGNNFLQNLTLSNLTSLTFESGSLQGNIGDNFMQSTYLPALTSITFPE